MKFSNLHLKRSAAIGIMLLTAALLGACSNDETTGSFDAPAPYSGSESHPITVAKGPVTLEVATHQGSLEPTQVNTVIGFTHQAMSSGLTPLTISRPSGGGTSSRTASEIASLVVQQGMPRSRLRMTTYSGPASGPVTLSYITTAARTTACGDWAEDVTETAQNTNTRNHGCAVQANIAAMVADPQTLIVPKPKTPILSGTRLPQLTSLYGGAASSAPSSAPSTPSPTTP
jgi:pilus assembly protein CpaD